MKAFSSRITIFAGLISGGISFLITAYDAFRGICDFHGNWLEFAGYLMNGLSGCIMNGIMVCCITGIIAFPLVKIMEMRIK